MADASFSGAAGGAAAGSTIGPWGAVAGGVLGLLGASGGQDAGAAQNAQNIAAMQQANQQNDPFATGGNRSQYVSQLNQLMQGGVGGVNQDPQFQKMEQQSLGNVQRMEAASGYANSGQAQSQLMSQSFNDQQSYFNQQYDRLSQLSGANTPVQASVGQSPSSAASQANQTGFNQGAGFGSIVTGLSSLFGNTNKPQDLPQTMTA